MLNLSIFMGSVDGAGWSTSHSHLARMLGIHRRKSLSRLPSFLLFSVFVPERCCLRFFPPRERQRQAVPDEQVQGQHHRHQPRGRQPPAGHAALPHLQQPAQAHQQQGARCGVYGDVPAPRQLPKLPRPTGVVGRELCCRMEMGVWDLGLGAVAGGRSCKAMGAVVGRERICVQLQPPRPQQQRVMEDEVCVQSPCCDDAWCPPQLARRFLTPRGTQGRRRTPIPS